MLDDYQFVISLLFSKERNELQREHEEARRISDEGNQIPRPTNTIVERAKRLWNTLLPHRTIDFSGNSVHVNYNGQNYHGKEMSDGEACHTVYDLSGTCCKAQLAVHH